MTTKGTTTGAKQALANLVRAETEPLDLYQHHMVHRPFRHQDLVLFGIARLKAGERLDAGQLWVNPDCGLKTRRWEDVKPTSPTWWRQRKRRVALAEPSCGRTFNR